MFHRTAENQEPSVASPVNETLPRDWFSDTESLEDPVTDPVSKIKMGQAKIIKHSPNEDKDDNDDSVATFPEDLFSCAESLDNSVINSASKTKADQKKLCEHRVNEDNDDDNDDGSAATPPGDLLSCTDSLDESLIDIISKAKNNQTKIIEQCDIEAKVDEDLSVATSHRFLFSCTESVDESLFGEISAETDQTTVLEERKNENKYDNELCNMGSKVILSDLRSDDRRAKDGREGTVIGTFICRRGTEDAGILACKIRALEVLQQEGCLWYDQCISEMEDGHQRITTLCGWRDIELFRIWMVSSVSIQFYEDNIDLAVPNSCQIAEFARVKNPFYVVKGSRRSFRNEELADSVLPQFSAFSVIIDFKVRANRFEEFKRKAWSSEVCAMQEDECLRYHIYVDWTENEDVENKQYTIYGVFLTREGFDHHASQGYSLLGKQVRNLCTRDPIISFFHRSSLSLSPEERS